MIAWKATFGAFSQLSVDDSWATFPDNAQHIFDNIVKVDISKFVPSSASYFAIPTVSTLEGFPIRESSPELASAGIYRLWGSESAIMWSVTGFNSTNATDQRNMEIQTPSIRLPYPDFDISSKNYPAMLIPSLNSIIVWGSFHSSGARTAIYSTKTGERIGNGVWDTGNTWAQNSAYFTVLSNYDGSFESLLDPANYAVIRQVQGGSSSTWNQYLLAARTSSAFINLFRQGDYNPPNYGQPDNPYEPGGESGPGGGGGTFDGNSDPIPVPTIPTLSSSNTGFTRIYNPTLTQVQDLARYLWTDESVIQTIWNHIKQFFENPMDAIIGFNLVPVPVPDGGTQNFALMYIDTGVSMTVAASQFVDVECGTLEIKPYYGSALDYSPYTKVSCFLPFIGTVSLNVDEVMGRTLSVKYRVDICSGSCVAYVTVDGNALYQFSGHCAISIPLSQADFSSYVNAAISVAKLAGAAMIGAAGAGAAAAASEAAQTTSETTTITNTARNPSTGRQITTGTQVITSERTESVPVTKASFAGLTPQNVSNTVGEIMNAKPHIEHSGSFSGNSGYLGVRRPFVIIERPNMCMPANYQTLNGFPAMITMSLGSCKGYTRVQQVQLTGLHATNPEQAEIMQLLKSGVIL